MSTEPTRPGPVASETLLELRRARSLVTLDLIRWQNGKFGASLGFTPISAENPRGMTRFVSIDSHEIPAVIAGLETARVRIEELETERRETGHGEERE
jgi:hypothetical protein